MAATAPMAAMTRSGVGARALLLAAALLAGCAHEHETSAAAPATQDATAPSAGTPVASERWHWSFEPGERGAAPGDFAFARTGPGTDGSWQVQAIDDAPGGRHVLVQLEADRTDDRYPLAIAGGPELADVRLSVSGRALSGEVDQVLGLVFRYRDPRTYYLARANALEENVRLYHVTNGRRQQIGHWKGTVAPYKWHTLEVEARGPNLAVSFDGKRVIELQDRTITTAGHVGLWTKADSVTQFDDLRAEDLSP
jgi:hypothetical protein